MSPKNSHWMTYRSHRVPARGLTTRSPAKISRSEIFSNRTGSQYFKAHQLTQREATNSNAIKPLPKSSFSRKVLINRPLVLAQKGKAGAYRNADLIAACRRFEHTMQEPEVGYHRVQPGGDQTTTASSDSVNK